MNRILLIIIIALSSCSESDRELGDDYYFLPKYESIDVGYPGMEAIIYKSGQEYLFSDVKILGDVIKVNSDKEHIVAKRDPITLGVNSKIFEYYIIIKKNDSILGPLDFDVFMETKKKIKVKINL